jgi:pimeloyl-ACP methyl ester carboxylesterase
VPSTRSADGTTIAFDRLGDGPPLVVVGGAFNGRAALARWTGPLSAHFTVLVHDRRGRGESGDTATYAVDREVEDLAAVLDAADAGAAVFGHSSGGALALEAAAAGLPISRLAVYEPPFQVGGTAGGAAGGVGGSVELGDEVDRLVSAGERDAAVELFLVRAIGLPPGVVEQIRSSPDWQGMVSMAHTLVYELRIVADSDVPTARLGSIAVPTLVLAGTAGWPWIADSARAVADAVPDGRFQVLEGQDHDVSAEALTPALVDFLAG